MTHILPERPEPQPSAGPEDLRNARLGRSNAASPAADGAHHAGVDPAARRARPHPGRRANGRGLLRRSARGAIGTGRPAGDDAPPQRRLPPALRARMAEPGVGPAHPPRPPDRRRRARVVGVLLLSRSPRVLFAGIYEDRGKIALGIVLIFATLVVLSGLLSRGIVRPVEALGDATRAVASGGGSVPPAPTTAAVEIQALYRDFGVMAEAIERRSRYLRDFAHAVSHEFKTPLAGIGGAVELLQDHPDMGAADRERFLANIAADAARLNQLVSRLLDLARADMAEMVEGAATDLSDVMRRVADAFTGANFDVVPEPAAALPSVAVPPAVVETVLTGLIENSRQAAASSVSITARASGGFVELAFRDDGPGIPAGDRGRIFEPFFTSRRTSGGTGLGLPIIRSLLQAHHGLISLDGDDGRGAVFLVTLPAYAAVPRRKA